MVCTIHLTSKPDTQPTMISRFFILSTATVRLRHKFYSDLIFHNYPQVIHSQNFLPSVITAFSATAIPAIALSSPFTAPTTLFTALQDFPQNVVSTISASVQSDSHRPVVSLIAINTFVYLMWKVCPYTFMVRCVYT